MSDNSRKLIAPIKLNHYYTVNGYNLRFFYHIFLPRRSGKVAGIVFADIPPKWHEISIIGLSGFLVAGVIDFWLLVSILRREKM